MADLDVHLVPALDDNYVFLSHDAATGACAAVDPSQSAPVEAALDRLGWKLTHILNTHAHGDHTGGNLDLKRKYGCKVVGAGKDAGAIPGLDIPVGEGDTVQIGASAARLMETPGHTSGHVVYWFEDGQALFSGDALFSLGCGRLFGGSAAQMWASLSRLRQLPGETKVYCAHEYTLANAKFALSVDPHNQALQRRAGAVRALRAAGKPAIPSTMAEERAANPFLRADNEDLRKAAGIENLSAVEAFAEIRRRKDRF
ncbi:MAG TPA: hydroxyacylglutathione hydrolase [Rhodospirillales bacterium]|nr:hydroxyacylglutathione hydrolase [Rhodospirillales bacterium]